MPAIKAEDIVVYAADPMLYGPMEVQWRRTKYLDGVRKEWIEACVLELDALGERCLGQREVFLEGELMLAKDWAEGTKA